MVSDREVESCLKRTHHQPDEHYGRVGQDLFPYSPRLRLHVGRHLVGFQAYWSPIGSVSVRSPIVSGSLVHVIRPSV